MVPSVFETDSFGMLRRQLGDFPVHWQHDCHHITMVFIDETHNADVIKSIICRNLANVHPIKITFDKFNAFTAHSGMHIIHLAASNVPNELLLLNKKIRKEIIDDTGSAIYSDFYLHVTLGRVMDKEIMLEDICRVIDKVESPSYSFSLNEVIFRYFRGPIISKTILA